MTKSSDQKGFGVVETLLSLILVAIVVFVGYYIYDSQKTANNTYDNAGKIAKNSSLKLNTKADPLLYEDSTGSLYSISALATTSTEKAIAKALDGECASSANLNGTTKGHLLVAATGAKDLFTAKSTSPPYNYKQEGDLAVVNMGCYDKTSGGAQWGDAALFYVYDKNGTWTYLTASQSQIDCNVVDGKDITSNLLTSCYDDTTGTTRAPKP